MNRSSDLTRRRWLIAIAMILAAIFAITQALDLKSDQQSLALARADLLEVKTKLRKIQEVQSAPQVASLQLDSPAQITNRIASALAAANIPPSSLLGEQPLDPQRLDRSDFEIRSTIINLAPTSLPLILAFCDSLRETESGTQVSGLKLTPPEENGTVPLGEETWKAEMTLTQMIYSPNSR
jgi:hypothetical protein